MLEAFVDMGILKNGGHGSVILGHPVWVFKKTENF
jgi:hypothetical protein